MLDRPHRLTSSAGFVAAVRRGRRAGSRTLVLHLGQARPAAGSSSHLEREPLPRVGFVVSKAVGNAVTRNRVKRRLRHLVQERLVALPDESLLVVRALPAAADASYATLATDLDAALRRLVPVGTGAGTGSLR